MTVAVPDEIYADLLAKAKAYDEMVEARRRGAKIANDKSREELQARAKKAVQARIEKYGQKRHIDN